MKVMVKEKKAPHKRGRRELRVLALVGELNEKLNSDERRFCILFSYFPISISISLPLHV